MEYKDTIFLPKTSFEMRANLPKKEPKIIDDWDNFRPKFIKVMPTEYRRALEEIKDCILKMDQ